MAIIGKIRKHAGITVGIVAVAMAGFILLQDQSGSGCSRNKSVEFAKIGKEKVSKSDFDARIEEQTLLYQKQAGKENLTPAENFQIMLSVWDQMVKEIIMQKEYVELGLAVEHDKTTKPSISPEELYDLILGKNLHPFIVQNFTDPATGIVNIQQIQSIVDNFEQLSEDDKKQWKMLEEAIKDDRLNTKYNTLVSQGYYMPKAFTQRLADEANRSAALRVFGVKYQTISDSAVTVSDEDFNKYYEAHKYEFEQEASVDMDYVIWDVVPSADDMKKITDEVNKIFAEFEKLESKDVDGFVRANSDSPYDSSFHKKGTLPVRIDSFLFGAPAGTMIAPYIENNVYYMARLMQIQDRPDSLNVSQILIAFKDAPNPIPNVTRPRDKAKAMADSIALVLKKDPKRFAELAMQKSDFPQAAKDQGKIGWLADGDVNYKFFYDSLYLNKTGEIKVIQSTMGYHVVLLEGKKDPVKKIKVATLTRDIKPGSETFNTYLAQASEFAGANRTADDFNKAIAAKGLNKRTAQFVRAMDYSIPGLETAREIIRWAYDKKTEKGMISEQVFDAQGKYVVVLVTEKREKGIAPLEQVKTYIEPLVKRDKKAEKIIAQINSAAGGLKDITAIALKLNVKVDTVDMLTFASYNFPNFGPEPELIGTVMSGKKGDLAGPFKGKMAVYEYIIDEIAAPPATMNPDMIKMQVLGYFRQRVSNDLFRAIKDKTDILDNRVLFY